MPTKIADDLREAIEASARMDAERQEECRIASLPESRWAALEKRIVEAYALHRKRVMDGTRKGTSTYETVWEPYVARTTVQEPWDEETQPRLFPFYTMWDAQTFEVLVSSADVMVLTGYLHKFAHEHGLKMHVRRGFYCKDKSLQVVAFTLPEAREEVM